MPCCKSTPSQIATSCTVLCIALCTVVITETTLLALLDLDNINECVSFYFGYEVTDVSLNASQFELNSNTVDLWGEVKLRYQRYDQTANSTWYMEYTYTYITYYFQCRTDDIPGTVWFCVASDVSCLPASWAYYATPVDYGVNVVFGISVWDSSSNIFYYYIFDPRTGPCFEHSIYDSTTTLFDLWANHRNCESITIAMLFLYCFCGVQFIPIFVGCVCVYRCIRKYQRQKRRERLLKAYPNYGANEIQSQPPPRPAIQYHQRPNTANYPVAFIVTPTACCHPSYNPPSSANSYPTRYSVLQRIPYRILSITPELINVQKLVVNKVAPKWKEFAILLSFDQHLIDIIDCDTRTCQEGCREMFRKWLRVMEGTGSMERTWETIVVAVERMEDFSLAAELADNLGSLYH